MAENHNILSMGQNTIASHCFDPDIWPYKPLVVPVVMSCNYKFSTPNVRPEFPYERYGNPTRNCLQDTVAALEGAKYALCFASGSTALFACAQLLNPGDAVVASNQLYGGTALYFENYAPKKGIQVTLVDAVADPENIGKALKKNTKMVWIETCGNPNLGIHDINKIAAVVSNYSKDILFIVDNTFLTPCFLKPLELGATIVMHSMTKYMSGHGDLLMGCLCTNRKDLYEELYHFQRDFGLMAPPFDCFLMYRSLKTMSLRVRQHASNAMAIAQYLESQPAVEQVLYPGLPSHPEHQLAKRMLSGYGGVVTFTLKGSKDAPFTFHSGLKLIICAASLGSTDTLICYPWYSSHSMIPEEARRELGVTEKTVRLAVGTEDVSDLIQDLQNGLNKLQVA